MTIKERIYAALNEAYPSLKNLRDDYFIIGSSALILSGITFETVHDIDILLTNRDALYLEMEWKHRKINYMPQCNDLFRSRFSRFHFSEMPIETMGNLEVNKNGIWTPQKVENYTTIALNDIQIKIPTKEEQIKIFRFWGREKDWGKVKLIEKM
jgi:hypothetical protein